MLLHLFVLLAGCFCCSSAEEPSKKIVLQNSVATLPCPHPEGDVSWSRLIKGDRVTLITVKNGTEEKKTNDKRYSSLADKSLVIFNVTTYDSVMYYCNQKNIYLVVTTDPNMVVPKAGDVPVTPRDDGQRFGLGPGQEGGAADTENQQASDLWKVFAGGVVGAGLMLSAVFILRFCSKKRVEINTNVTKMEAIYEEIEGVEQQPRRESDVESPYYWTSISETQSTSTPPNNNMYSAVNKLKNKGCSSEECVYYLAQNPTQTGNVSE